ncbi:ATP-binding protein [Sorangium sp. So ce131]|uniref:hybrid sensor histidine kinase/response regulator n=1 Tax=Sorangium sp. So ce131 TaxID=3133282 RepID=UPI003F600BDE
MQMFRDPSARDDVAAAQRLISFDVPRHLVQFYESDGFLVDRVTAFLTEGLLAGQPLLVIATGPHRETFAAGLTSAGFNVAELCGGGHVTFLDARETLSTFMDGDRPDAERFRRSIGGTVSQILRGRDGALVRAFGEMVDVLWQDGNPDGAIRLEELWNELADGGRVAILCGYALGGFHKEAHGRQFQDVCSRHARVIPTELYMQLDEQARLREVSALQQRARALESEIEYRKELECALRQALEERERAEAERGRLLALETAARAEAEAASRLKDEFLAVLSHELRTPLNAILGWAHIASDAPADGATVRHALEVIRRNAAVQLRVIDDLLDVSRIVAGKMGIHAASVDLGDVLTAALDSVRPAAEAKGIAISLQIDESARVAAGDAARLQQVFWNLLSNALKFTPEAGRIEVRLDRAGGEARVVVRDTGRGIAPEFLPHVFERFRQEDTGTARKHGGLGLGLAVVRYLVEAHGGTVDAESAGEGRGATFTVTLPLRPPEPGAPRSAAVERPASLQHVRVLVVDDDADTRELFAYMLARAGAATEGAASVEEALARLASERFDVLISDIGMPERDGYVLMDAVRGHTDPRVRSIRAIAVTSYAGDSHRARAIDGGFDEYVAKPLEPARFASTIAELVARPARDGRAAGVT